jgi:hypothetical protein
MAIPGSSTLMPGLSGYVRSLARGKACVVTRRAEGSLACETRTPGADPDISAYQGDALSAIEERNASKLHRKAIGERIALPAGDWTQTRSVS